MPGSAVASIQYQRAILLSQGAREPMRIRMGLAFHGALQDELGVRDVGKALGMIVELQPGAAPQAAQ